MQKEEEQRKQHQRKINRRCLRRFSVALAKTGNGFKWKRTRNSTFLGKDCVAKQAGGLNFCYATPLLLLGKTCTSSINIYCLNKMGLSPSGAKELRRNRLLNRSRLRRAGWLLLCGPILKWSACGWCAESKASDIQSVNVCSKVWILIPFPHLGDLWWQRAGLAREEASWHSRVLTYTIVSTKTEEIPTIFV